MQYRTLGKDLKVSAIGVGCMPMVKGGNITYGDDADPDEAIKTIHRAIDLGITFLDTAQIYGPFSNEELVGEAIKGKRDGLVIASKFGFKFDGGDIVGVDGSAANAKSAVEGTLKRLGIDCLDLYYQHRVDPAVPIEETVGAMADLITEGKSSISVYPKPGPKHCAVPLRSRRSLPCKANIRFGSAKLKTKFYPPAANSTSALCPIPPWDAAF